MNVWLWGPPLWDCLHKAAYVCDTYKLSARKLLEPLREILPCKYCRESYNVFYETLGTPAVGHAMQWVKRVHSMVNQKLALQRLGAFLETREYPEYVKQDLKKHFPSIATSEPSVEIIEKRVLLQWKHVFHIDSLALFLLAFSLNIDDNTNQVDKLRKKRFFFQFVQALAKCASMVHQHHIVHDLLTIGPASTTKDLEFITNKSTDSNHLDLLRAHACKQGSCV